MASKYLQKYPVPENFQEILHDFTREVLRDQPEDIVKYAANYFECLNTGKRFEFQSKYNIPKAVGPKKAYQPVKAADLSAQAKNVVERSNTGKMSQNQNRLVSGNSRASSKQNVNDVSNISSAKESYADEKKVTKQFIGNLYPKAVNEIIQTEELDEGQGDDQVDNGDQFYNAADFVNYINLNDKKNEDQMKKVIKIQSHAKGVLTRKVMKEKKKSTQSLETKIVQQTTLEAQEEEFEGEIEAGEGEDDADQE